jgi:hypothetical protein
VLPATESAAARKKLIEELGPLASIEDVTAWAYRHMATKNALTVKDAVALEETFQAKLDASFPSEPAAAGANCTIVGNDPPAPSGRSVPLPGRGAVVASGSDGDNPEKGIGAVGNLGDRPAAGSIDKSVLTISEPRRYRNKAHLKFVAAQACLVCGRQPADPHHVAFAQPRALGRKASDEFTVPLCRTHHRELHRSGNERNWWAKHNLNPLAVAEVLWKQTRPGSDIVKR